MTQAITVYEDTAGLALAGDPEAALESAARAAKALVRMVDQTKSFTAISGNKHLKFEAWQTVGMFYGVTARVPQGGLTPRLDDDGHCIGYDAYAEVMRHGEVIGGASNFCLFSEGTWSKREEFQVASMAQTRAMSKALRSVLAFVAVLAGYEATPAEEMGHEAPRQQAQRPPSGQQRPAGTGKASPAQVNAIKAIAPKQGWSNDDVAAHCRSVYDAADLTDLAVRQASEFINFLRSGGAPTVMVPTIEGQASLIQE